jgi:ATP-dependent Lon protease
MSSCTDLVPLERESSNYKGGRIPIAHMRHVYRLSEVEKKLGKLPPREHESLRATYERMLEKGSERFQVKPSAGHGAPL